MVTRMMASRLVLNSVCRAKLVGAFAKIMMETSVFRVVNNLVYGYPNVFSFRTVKT